MGGALGKKKKPEERQSAAQIKAHRKLSIVGVDAMVTVPGGDPNIQGTVTDKGANVWQRYSSLSNAGYEPDGNKKTNQDSFFSINEFGDKEIAIFGVFDGHGACGHHVSGYVKREIPKSLDEALFRAESKKSPADAYDAIAKALNDSFIKVNGALEKDKGIDSSLSGTTAVMVAVMGGENGRHVVCANAGDSRAMIAREEPGGNFKAVELSEDQKPDREDEKARILQYGGRVEPLIDEMGEPIGPFRVWLPNMMLPGLAMARSLGDDIAATVGVYATPEIRQHTLTEADRFMVIASDGVWEFLSNEDVIDIVNKCNGDADRACQEVCGRSYREWRGEEDVVDDITCVVVYFNKC